MICTRQCTVLLISAFFGLTCPAMAQDDFGVVPLGAGFAGKPFVLDGDVVIETDGLYDSIRDYAQADEPVLIGWNDHGCDGFWQDVRYDDGLLVALRGPHYPSGFAIYDLSDLINPVILAEFVSNLYTSAWFRDRTLIVSLPSALLVYDLDEPAEPAFSAGMMVGELNTDRWFCDAGNTLFCIDHDAAMRVLDITDPRHPVDLGTLTLPGQRIDAAVVAQGYLHAVLAIDDAQRGGELVLATFDVTSPLAPVETSREVLSSDSMASGVELTHRGQLLLAATSDGHLRAFGLHDPAMPEPGWELLRFTEHLALSEHWIFHQCDERQAIYPLVDHQTPPGQPVERSMIPRLLHLFGQGPIQVVQHYDRAHMLAQIDVSNSLQPVLGEWCDVGLAGSFYASDSLGLMVGMDDRARLLDYQDPEGIILLGQIQVPGVNLFGPAALADEAAVVYGMVENEHCCLVFDIHDPLNPYLKSKVDCGFPSELRDGILLASEENFNLQIVDLSDLSMPEILCTLDFSGIVRDLCLGHGFAGVLIEPWGRSELQIFDMSSPARPALRSVIPLESVVTSLVVHQDLIVARSCGRNWIFDVSDLAHPVQTAFFARPPGAESCGLTFHGDLITQTRYLATYRYVGQGTVHTPDATPIAACGLDPAYPNPFNPSTTIAFSVDRRRELTVTIHDLRGHKIADLATGLFTPGRHDVTWQGQDAAGRSVASGVYLVRLHGPGVEAAQTVTLVK